jgi:hypothetical protein
MGLDSYTTPEYELPAGAVFAGRYKILARLGSGSANAVYKARDLLAGVIIALKLAASEDGMHPRILARLQHELSQPERIRSL